MSTIASGPPWDHPGWTAPEPSGTWQYLVPRPAVEETRPQQAVRAVTIPPHRVLLGLILMVQAVLSLALIRANTAFGDEATYLTEGRMEWAHWLHGAPLPALHNSGSPWIYPPLGAIASAIGGLEGARLLSLGFMLGATFLLYLTATHLTGRTGALWAAALFGCCEPVLRLAFATYDPLACLLVTGSVYLAVRPSEGRQRAILAVASGLCLGLAALTAVSFAAYIPAVLAVSFCGRAVQDGWRRAQGTAGIQLAVVLTGSVAGLSVMRLWSSAAGSTLSRHRGLGYSVASVLKAAWGWEGLILCAAVAGAWVAFERGRRDPRGWLMASCALSACIVPAYQAYIGSAWSLDKHLSAGAGLAAIAAGYVAAQMQAKVTRKWAVPVACAALLAYPVITGWIAASTVFGNWANTSTVVADLKPYDGQQVLVAGPVNITIFRYYLPGASFVPAGPGSAAAIASGRFGVVVTDLNAEGLADPRQVLPSALTRQGKGLAAEVIAISGGKLVGALESSHEYVLAKVIPYRTTSVTNSAGVFAVWRLVSPAR